MPRAIAWIALRLSMLIGFVGCLPTEPDKPAGPSLAGEWDVVPPPCEVMACWHQPAELVTAVEFVRFGRDDGLEERVRIEPEGAYEVTIVQDGEVVEQYAGALTPAAVAELAGLLHDWEADAEEASSQAHGRYGARPLQTDAECAVNSTLPQPLLATASRPGRPERERGSEADSAKGGDSGTGPASRPCPLSCGRYEITYASQTCGWPAVCAYVPQALKCVVLKVVENTALDGGCVRLEFLDR